MKNFFDEMLRDKEGKLSFMRCASLLALLLGVLVGLCGIWGFIFKLQDAITIIATSQAMIALVIGAKAWQKSSE